MSRPRKRRRRGFYARLARARGVPFHTVYLALNPDKRPWVRAKHECDASLPWSRLELIRMDKAFCDAVRRAIARGTERPRGPVAKPTAARAIRRLHAAPLRSGVSSPAALCAETSESDRFG